MMLCYFHVLTEPHRASCPGVVYGHMKRSHILYARIFIVYVSVCMCVCVLCAS